MPANPGSPTSPVSTFGNHRFKPFQFVKQLSKEQAEKRIHLKVTYDKFDRITDVQVRQNGDFKELGYIFAPMYVHTVHTKVTYQDDREVHTFFDRFGNQVTGWGDVWRKVYHKNGKGLYSSMEFLSREGKAIENSWGIKNYNWQHRNDGSIVEARYNSKGELQTHRPFFEFKRIRMVFAPDGTLRLMQNIDENDKLVASKSGAAQYLYYYNSINKFTRWEVLDAEGNPALGPTGTAGEFYVHEGTASEDIHFFDKSGKPTKHHSGALIWSVKADKYGNMAERHFLDEKHKRINGRDGFSSLIQQWDENGFKMLSKKYFDKDGNAFNVDGAFHEISYTYHKNGLVDEVRVKDASGKPAMHTDISASVIKHNYDTKGILRSRTMLDTEGNVVETAK